MTNSSMSYRERLKQRQRQEVDNKDKQNAGRSSYLDYSLSPIEVVEWKPEYLPKEHAIDILPFIITEPWMKNLRTPSGIPLDFEMGDLYYKLQLPFHKNVGPTNRILVCNREAFGYECEQCNQMFDFYRQGEKEKAKALRATWRTFYDIFDYDMPDIFCQLFQISYFSFEASPANDPQRASLLNASEMGPDGLVVFSDLEEGKIVLSKFKKKILPSNKKNQKDVEFPEIFDIKFEDRQDPYTMDDLKNVYPLDKMASNAVVSPETFSNIFYGADMQEDDSSQQRTEPEPSRTRSRQTTSQPPADPNPEPQGRTRRRNQEPAETNNEGQCPAGGRFGYDCNQIPECQGNSENSCSEDVFQICLRKHDELSTQSEQLSRTRSRGTEQTENTQQNSAPESTTRTHRRRGR